MKKLIQLFLLISINLLVVDSNELQLQSYKLCNEELGYCVPSTRCSNRTEFSDGAGVFNSRFSLDDVEESGECHYLEACCEPENIISAEESQTQIEDHVNEDTLQECYQQCRVAPVKISTLTHEPSNGCGFRNRKGVGLEISQSSNVAQFGEFPWHLALLEKNNSNLHYFCGASLIHPQVALTSAHCISNKLSSDLKVRAGEWDTQTTNEPFPHSDFDAIQILVHPNFDNQSLVNDVALVVLENRVKLSAHINTICLPPQNFKFDNKTCVASGWGKDNFDSQSAYRVNLKKLELPVVPLRDCQDRLRKTKLGDKFKLSPSFMCAGGEKDADTCVGDGGSALMCGIPGEVDNYYQAGIVAWGIECGSEGVPGVYGNVAKFRDWIDVEMSNLDFGTESYTF